MWLRGKRGRVEKVRKEGEGESKEGEGQNMREGRERKRVKEGEVIFLTMLML